MVDLNVYNFVENPLKTLFKTMENFVNPFKILLQCVYKLSFHRLFQSFSTAFYTNSHSLLPINIFHYSTYPTTKTTKYINIEERKKV